MGSGGEHVVAVGFPLSQQMSVTTGIVSSVRPGAITSDVRINHGNSGGPLLNLRGQVVGVNTFLETDEGTAGVSGAVTLVPLAAVLESARAATRSGSTAAKKLLPLLPSQAFPIAVLRQTADTATDGLYDEMASLDADNFTVSVSTPVSTLASITRVENALWGARTRRERQAPAINRDRLRQFAPYRDWTEYVGDETAPAVVIEIVPKVGRTTGTTISNILGAVAAGLTRTAYEPGTQHMEFKGDVEWVRFYRNGDPIAPVLGGRTPQRVLVSNAFVEMRDVAYRGIYVFRPEVFAPDSSGRPPSVIMVIGDLAHPTDQLDYELPPNVASRVWNDFLPYFRATGQGSLRSSDPTKRFASLQQTFCESRDCTGGDAIESGPASHVRIAGWATDGGGMLVSWVPRASPASRAGLRAGDLIVSIDGRSPQNVSDVVRSLEEASSIPRILYRRQDRLGWAAEGTDSVFTGLQLDAERRDGNGVKVASVAFGSRAAASGLRSGDCLVAVDGQAALTVEALEGLLQRNRSGHWRLGIQRGSSQLEVSF
ncbi:MAG: trypsin-like peptidase domain-containing protein [Acidobacteriia bacterium]|nr:trypsin-like peptidase domain-containing protein [Terriglobia bacterium]